MTGYQVNLNYADLHTFEYTGRTNHFFIIPGGKKIAASDSWCRRFETEADALYYLEGLLTSRLTKARGRIESAIVAAGELEERLDKHRRFMAKKGLSMDSPWYSKPKAE